MQWWLIVVIVLCVPVVAIVGSLISDKYRRRSSEQTQQAVEMVPLDTTDSWARNNTIIVYLPGLLARADAISPRVLKTWAEHGEVWGANYIPPRFLPERIVEDVAAWIWERFNKDDSAQRLILVGSSMGGLLATDVLQSLRLGISFHTRLMPIDAPTRGKDLQYRWLAQWARILPFGPLWNHLSKPIMKQLFLPPKAGEIDADVDPVWLAEQVEGARSFPVSFWRDQVMYILKHGELKPGSIRCPITYIRSTGDDDTVREDAKMEWFMACSNSRFLVMEAVGAKHAAYAQNPSAYEKVFPEAFESLE